ncbi:hypothetical protein DY000_02013274 [Brassica cretica]|uniref:Thymidine kinase n=1 Tax=Brassica cretica TaxID=69181 RepID=A0ABQ7CZZ7_BRACR|nr:hypothetical protein DY000_02013274 [Brassica cretica]
MRSKLSLSFNQVSGYFMGFIFIWALLLKFNVGPVTFLDTAVLGHSRKQQALNRFISTAAVSATRTGDLYEFCCKDADDDGNTVIVAVVDGRVGDVLDIVQIDDSVTKLTARCEVCGHKGFFTVRKTCDTRTELIGGVDVYMPVCLKHYINNQIVIKASK